MSGCAAAGLVLAHGGGAPETLMVGLPVAILVVFAVLERRARRREREQEQGGPPADET